LGTWASREGNGKRHGVWSAWALAATLALGIAAVPAGARAADVITPHEVGARAVSPHVVDPAPPPALVPAADAPAPEGAEDGEGAEEDAPPAVTPPKADGSSDAASEDVNPSAAEPPPAYLQCPDSGVRCTPVSPEQARELKERLEAELHQEAEELKARLDQWLAAHPPRVVHLYMSQLLCPTVTKVWVALTRRYLEAVVVPMSPSKDLAQQLAYLSGFMSDSRSCEMTVPN
jgi:hypothetical protein